jgi:hypothetical protein
MFGRPFLVNKARRAKHLFKKTEMIYSCFECVWFKHSLLVYCRCRSRHQIRREVVREVTVTIAVLCDVTPCSLVDLPTVQFPTELDSVISV